jgi:hypothetical protein
MKFEDAGYVNTRQLIVRQINKNLAASFVIQHHYTHKASSCRYALGLYFVEDNEHKFFEGKVEKLIGVMTYGHPVSNRTVASITNEHKLELDEVLELTRLVVLDGGDKYRYGCNTESWFIGQSFKWLKKNAPEVKVLVSYADPEQEHSGSIYRATNWMYQGCGVSKLMPDFSILLVEDGLWMHSRTVGSKFGNKSVDNLAKRIGHTFYRKEETAKHRYIYFLCDKKEKKQLISDLKIPILPYNEIKDYEQLIQKVIVKDRKVERIEILQGQDNGWVNKQGQDNGSEEEES